MWPIALLLVNIEQSRPVEPPRPFPSLQIRTWMESAAPVDVKSLKGKVVLVHFSPSFCCGYDFTAKMVHKALQRYGSQGLTAFGVVSGTLDADQIKIWNEVRPQVPVSWPVGVDNDGMTRKALFPKVGEVEYSFCFIDRQGRLRKFAFKKLDDMFPVAEKLLAERA